MVHVNSPTFGGEAQIPFGGMKSSGVGDGEQGATALEFTALAPDRVASLVLVDAIGPPEFELLGTHLGLRDDPSIAYRQITHPSPLGLMGMAKRAGKGVRVRHEVREGKKVRVSVKTGEVLGGA